MNVMMVIAFATLKGLVRERVFHAALVLNFLFLCFAAFLSTLTFVEQRKILLDFGFAAASFVGVGFAIFLGSSFVRKELDSRTVYTLLAKPVGRTQYLLGKFFGGAAGVIGLNLISYLTLVAAIAVQGEAIPKGFLAVVYLGTLECLLFLSVSLTISLLCSTLFLGATLSFAVFLVGRSAYALHQMAEKASRPMGALLETIYTIFPAGQRFDVRELVAYGREYPAGVVGPSSLYFIAYVIVVLMIAALSFRRKDLP